MAMTVLVELGRAGAQRWTARITPSTGPAHLVRFGAPTAGEHGPLTDEHLSTALSARAGAGPRQCADVLFEDRPYGPLADRSYGPLAAERTAAEALRAFPGCAVAAIGAGREIVVLTRTGECVRLPRTTASHRQPAVLGSLVHAWLVAGGRVTDLVPAAALPGGHAFEMTAIRPASRSASPAPSPW
ncbi:hypothetical protein [Kitasatospora sp. NPDC101183]|uniref:hypothetical protein n=1 Tax=Kitasatospora sp. NPDC101183 TaxID=3364100 RepID=UPI00382151F1